MSDTIIAIDPGWYNGVACVSHRVPASREQTLLPAEHDRSAAGCKGPRPVHRYPHIPSALPTGGRDRRNRLPAGHTQGDQQAGNRCDQRCAGRQQTDDLWVHGMHCLSECPGSLPWDTSSTGSKRPRAVRRCCLSPTHSGQPAGVSRPPSVAAPVRAPPVAGSHVASSPSASSHRREAVSLSRPILTTSGRNSRARVQSITIRNFRPHPGICSR